MTSETDAFQQFMFCRAFSSLESIQNALQNILGINHEGSLSNVETNLEKTKKNIPNAA
jgi:hypothetical protein